MVCCVRGGSGLILMLICDDITLVPDYFIVGFAFSYEGFIGSHKV